MKESLILFLTIFFHIYCEGFTKRKKAPLMEDLEAQQNKNYNDNVAIFKQANRPVTLKFKDVIYTIKTKKQGSCFQKKKKSEEKIILKGISGIVNPGEMLAMLGPSGSGKTTLLTALGGRLAEGKLTGKISYNDKHFNNIMKRNTGFVTQDDVLYPHLTVTETLVFTALLRLPNIFTNEEKTRHAEAVITQLGLTRCKNSIIGDPFMRGISGGERKRVSIGQEMLINPSLLLLDEPTSGLDSTTAQRIVSMLRDLAIGGRTIAMTIHQPSSRLFYMFNKVLLLSEGYPLYFGNGSGAMDYFESVGYAPSVAMNPSDFMLDLANGIAPDEIVEDRNSVKQSLVSAYKNNLAENLKAEVEHIDNDHSNKVEEKKVAKWATTWWQQFTILLKRGLKERKYESFSFLKVGQVVVVAVLVGLLWWQSDVGHLQDQTGLLFFYTGFWEFFPLFQAIFTFPPERKMLEKERSSGMYKLSSYFMARIVGDLPMELILPTFFITATYWMAGLKHSFINFLLTLFVILLNVLVSQGLGLALGALVMNLQSATVLGSVIMLSFLLAGGYYVTHVPVFVSWIQYFSISNYAYKLLIGAQYTANETYPCGDTFCLVGDFPPIKKIGFGYQGLAVLALGIMLVFYRLVAYLALMRIGVTKN